MGAAQKKRPLLTSSQRLERLRQVVDELDMQELVLAYNSRIKAIEQAAHNVTVQTVAARRAALDEFNRVLDTLEARYFPPEEPEQEPAAEQLGERFANRMEAVRWLQDQGYQIGKTKLYEDCQAGMLAVARDGSLSKFDVLLYGTSLEDKGLRPAWNNPEAQAKKEYLELRRLELEVQSRERKAKVEDDRYLHRDEAWAAVAAILGQLADNLRHELFQAVPLVLHRACGELDRGPEIYSELETAMYAAFNGLRHEITGIFEVVDDDSEQ